jgi:dipeptidyl aminopeptidase/acylaminoacyl peptidase
LGGKAIAALQFSPDSQVLAVRTQGEIVLLWDVNQRQEKLRLSNQGNNACTVAFSPDGAFWATMRDPESIVIRRGLTDVEVARHGARWADVAWSPDGRMIAVASGARMTLLDAATRGVLHEFDCCGSWIDSLAFAPDSRKLVTVSGTGRLAVWDVSSIEALKVATTPPVDSVASKNGRYSSPLRIYDAPDDRARFGDFCEYGLRNREDEIPDGYWVYSAPRWYVFRQSRIGLGAPPRDLPEPYLHAGQRRIWIACPNASCVQAGCKAALGMPRRIQQVKRAMLIYQHGFQFKDTARSWGPTAVLEVYLDERTGTEEALELIDRDGWGLEEAEILDSTEARAAGLIDGP